MAGSRSVNSTERCLSCRRAVVLLPKQAASFATWLCRGCKHAAFPPVVVRCAALQCGAHARSLQYFETHLRTLHKGALNPAAHRSASYGDEDVSYLQASMPFGCSQGNRLRGP